MNSGHYSGLRTANDRSSNPTVANNYSRNSPRRRGGVLKTTIKSGQSILEDEQQQRKQSPQQQHLTTELATPTTSNTGNGLLNQSNTATTLNDNTATNVAASNASTYSSRNSLRTATSFSMANDPKCLYSTPKIEAYTLGPSPKDTGEISNYILMTPKIFVTFEPEKPFIYCILCGMRQPFRDEQPSHVAQRHLDDEHHDRSYFQLTSALCDIPPGVDSFQMSVIKELLTKWYNAQILRKDHIDARKSIIRNFNAILTEIDPQCRSILIGSFASHTSLITSDINLELIHSNSRLFESDPRAKNSLHHKLVDENADLGEQINYHTLHYDLIPNAFSTLNSLKSALEKGYTRSPQACSFRVTSDMDDLNGKVPKLVLQDMQTGIELKIICYAESSHKLASLLSSYMLLDERACILSILVKYWAKICRIDNTDAGTLPPDAYVILVIYFLQRTSPPILPCIHEIISKGTKTTALGHKNLIDLFTDLDIKSNTSAIHDDNTNASSSDKRGNNDSILDHLSRTEHPATDVELVDDGAECDDEEDDMILDPENFQVKNLRWVSSNSTPVQKLFVDFLKSMSSEFSNISTVISIRTLREQTLASKKWNSQVKSIENPVSPRSNISRCIGSQRIFEYMRSCFKQGFQCINLLPVDAKLRPRFKVRDNLEPMDLVQFYCQKDKLQQFYETKRKKMSFKWNTKFFQEMIDENMFAKDIGVLSNLMNLQLPLELALESALAESYELDYFVPKDIGAVTFCRLCKQSGHFRKSCPRNKVENLLHESETYDYVLDLNNSENGLSLDYTLLQCYNRDRIYPNTSLQHKKAVDELTKMINEKASIGVNCHLQLFGSTVNTLGSFDSDIDICMTLEGNPTGRGVDFVEVMRKVYNVLIQDRNVNYVQPIISTRVPIIKFTYYNFDVDLSMYNLCATHNSRLLKAYSLIDPRVAQLFYVVKKYAKECLIADASQGSLSSYAWSILVIHYLQRTSPPILPVLQEVEPGREKPMVGVNGWNVWFDEQFRSMPKQNTLTLTQLYKGFLLYYGNFDFRYYVVSIRKSDPLTRFEKSWNNCMMAIEDPFELTYNLAGRLDDLMAIYIINSFALNFRYIVHVQQQRIKELKERRSDEPKSVKEARLFNGRNIMGREPPFRGCRRCHRVGHRFKDCPQSRKGRNMPFPDRPAGVTNQVEQVTQNARH